eukprot:Gb_09947 [translate_table: standard]
MFDKAACMIYLVLFRVRNLRECVYLAKPRLSLNITPKVKCCFEGDVVLVTPVTKVLLKVRWHMASDTKNLLKGLNPLTGSYRPPTLQWTLFLAIGSRTKPYGDQQTLLSAETPPMNLSMISSRMESKTSQPMPVAMGNLTVTVTTFAILTSFCDKAEVRPISMGNISKIIGNVSLGWVVLDEKIGHVQIITLNRPRLLNVISSKVVYRLAELYEKWEKDTDAEVIIIKGAGRAFSAGGDLRMFYEGRAGPFRAPTRTTGNPTIMMLGLGSSTATNSPRVNGSSMALRVDSMIYLPIPASLLPSKIEDPLPRSKNLVISLALLTVGLVLVFEQCPMSCWGLCVSWAFLFHYCGYRLKEEVIRWVLSQCCFAFPKRQCLWRKRYPVSKVAIVHGLAMGGGASLTVPATFSVVTEKTVFATPEAGLGFHTDCSFSYILAHLPGHLGEYLALTGARLDGAEMIATGLATHFVPSEKLPELEKCLIDLNSGDKNVVRATIEEFSLQVQPGEKSILHK